MTERGAPIFFWGHTKGEYSFLSNFYRSPFTDEKGIRYNFSEQFFVKRKQELFDPHNSTLARLILESRSPISINFLGRHVQNFNEREWGIARYQTMLDAVRLKFSQNQELRAKLLATGLRELVEASPMDNVWGIGLSSQQAARTDPRRWPGLNLLGKVLMEVREYSKERGGSNVFDPAKL